MKIGFLKSSMGIVLGIAFIGLVVIGFARGWIGSRGPAALSPEALEFQVHQALRSQDWSSAQSMLDALGPAMSVSARVAILRAEVEGSQGKIDAAVATLSSIAENDPLGPRSRMLIGQIEKSRDLARKSEAAYLDAVRLDPTLVEARRELAFLYSIQGRREAMRTQFLALEKLDALDLTGVFLWICGYFDLAYNPIHRPTLERFVAADPDDRLSRLALAEVLLGKSEFDKSEEVVRPLPNSDADALGIRLRIAVKRVRIDDALALAKLGPAEHPVLCRLRGQLALKNRDASTALEQFRIAQRLDPTNRDVAQGLAATLQLLGDAKEAQACRDRATKLRSFDELVYEQFENFEKGKKDPTMPKRVGAACESVGLYDEARAWYELAIGIDPLDPAVQKALHALRRRSTPGS